MIAKDKHSLSSSAPVRYVFSMVASVIATTLLFLCMVILINFNYQRQEMLDSRLVNTTIEKIKEAPPEENIIAKLQSETKKLKEPVSLPPALATKTSIRSPLPPSRSTVNVNFSPSLDIIASIDITHNFGPLNVTGGNAGLSGSAISGTAKGYGDTPGIGGALQCTIVFTVGRTEFDIEELQWIDCLNGKIVNESEAALYKWVTRDSQSYLNLNPKPGEKIEFTYEQKL